MITSGGHCDCDCVATFNEKDGVATCPRCGHTWRYKSKAKGTESMQPQGYHVRKVEKGVLGKSSKVREELDELLDAEEQGNRILVHCELADLYGALRALAQSYDLTMDDLVKMCNATEAAFRSGAR